MNTQYNLRIAVLRRTNIGRTAQNEAKEEWPEHGRHSAKRLALNAGEEIRLGVKEGKEFLKIEIVGQKVDVQYGDRIRVIATGKVYRITADPSRLERVTVLAAESL